MCQLDQFDDVTQAALTKVVVRAPTKPCWLDVILKRGF